MEKQMIRAAIKILSENDVGANGSHQAGFLVPKLFVKEGLFEKLADTEINPRLKLKFVDLMDDSEIFLNYIYYNNKLFGGTRHEYRLTGLTRWIKNHGLKPGDSIQMTRISSFDYSIEIIKRDRQPKTLSEDSWIALYGKGTNND
jgi:hypothetical protein